MILVLLAPLQRISLFLLEFDLNKFNLIISSFIMSGAWSSMSEKLVFNLHIHLASRLITRKFFQQILLWYDISYMRLQKNFWKFVFFSNFFYSYVRARWVGHKNQSPRSKKILKVFWSPIYEIRGACLFGSRKESVSALWAPRVCSAMVAHINT